MRTVWRTRAQSTGLPTHFGGSGDDCFGGAVPGGQVGEALVVGEDLDEGLANAEALLQALHVELLVPEHESGDHARLAGPRRAPRPVDVALVVFGRVVVDDHVNVV